MPCAAANRYPYPDTDRDTDADPNFDSHGISDITSDIDSDHRSVSNTLAGSFDNRSRAWDSSGCICMYLLHLAQETDVR